MKQEDETTTFAVTPKRLVLVFATQRSGSTLLCQTLQRMGGLGAPDEYFQKVDPSVASDDSDLMSILAKRGRLKLDEPTVGVKIMVNHTKRVAECLGLNPKTPAEAMQGISNWAHDKFDSVGAVVIRRRSMFDQTISRVEAQKTGVYHRTVDGREIHGDKKELKGTSIFDRFRDRSASHTA